MKKRTYSIHHMQRALELCLCCSSSIAGLSQAPLTFPSLSSTLRSDWTPSSIPFLLCRPLCYMLLFVGHSVCRKLSFALHVEVLRSLSLYLPGLGLGLSLGLLYWACLDASTLLLARNTLKCKALTSAPRLSSHWAQSWAQIWDRSWAQIWAQIRAQSWAQIWALVWARTWAVT